MKIANLLLLSFIYILSISCQNKGYREIEHLLAEWSNKEIVFPDEPIFTRFANDTISYRIPESKHKIVVFVDSIGCTSCKLQLHKWIDFMCEIDSLCENEVPFIFFFQSNNIHEVRHILRSENFTRPVCIDIKDVFNSLNHFPHQMMFQTFLLDVNNRVKVLGNPIHNHLVKKLYIQELTGVDNKLLYYALVKTDSIEYNFGDIKSNMEVSKEIIFRNIGENVFYIEGITTSCNCINVEYNWDEIQPGEEASILVKYKSEEAGFFWRSISVFGNIPDESITLDFTGTVRL